MYFNSLLYSLFKVIITDSCAVLCRRLRFLVPIATIHDTCTNGSNGPCDMTVMPWKSGRVLVWDATCPDTFAPSHLQLATREAGAVADQAERRKIVKYIELAATHHFIPVAIESTGVFGPQAHAFFRKLGRRIKEETGEPLSLHYLYQRIAVAIQRGNAAAVLGTSPPGDTDPIFIR